LFSDVSSSDGMVTMARKEHAASRTTETKKAAGRKPQTDEPGLEPGIESTTTAIHVPKVTWMLLRAVAFHRAQANGGRASVSKLITELVERHRPELERETSQ
jgi:hypothetical protein